MSDPGRSFSCGFEAMRLLAALRQQGDGRVKLMLNLIWGAFKESSPEHALSSEARPRLCAILHELEGCQQIAFPKGRAWDTDASPPLPHWVRLVTPPHQTNGRDTPKHRRHPWAPELRFVAELERVVHLDELLRINRFLAKGGRLRPMVPLRERSAELFDHEKRLEQLAQTQLFGPGRLSLATLRCFCASPPLVWERASASRNPALLVVENHHSYHSLCAWNRDQAYFRAVVYGAGKAIEGAVETVAKLYGQLHAERTEYFGDLDPEGIRIPVRANARIERMGLDIRLTPAAWLYGHLLRLGEGRRFMLPTGRPLNESEAAWLPATIRDTVCALFAAHLRLPQELVGAEVLRRIDCP